MAPCLGGEAFLTFISVWCIGTHNLAGVLDEETPGLMRAWQLRMLSDWAEKSLSQYYLSSTCEEWISGE